MINRSNPVKRFTTLLGLAIALSLLPAPGVWRGASALPIPTGGQEASEQFVAFWQRLLAQTPPPPEQRRPRRRLGVRGSICAVSPGLLEPQNLIWGDRPLFLWQSDTRYIQMQRLEVTDAEGRIVWEKPLDPMTQAVVYAGPSLQPGEFYTWQLTWQVEDQTDAIDYTFQMMDATQREQIAADLEALAQQAQRSSEAEAIALRQVSYFIDAELWSDAMQVLYTLESPSATATEMLQDWTAFVCGEE
ncbi:MAG: hypothetical protein VKK04_00080 [Synechococcales bacterium]|nr:hypothetical protein [Synechococcales bacterium]